MAPSDFKDKFELKHEVGVISCKLLRHKPRLKWGINPVSMVVCSVGQSMHLSTVKSNGMGTVLLSQSMSLMLPTEIKISSENSTGLR